MNNYINRFQREAGGWHEPKSSTPLTLQEGINKNSAILNAIEYYDNIDPNTSLSAQKVTDHLIKLLEETFTPGKKEEGITGEEEIIDKGNIYDLIKVLKNTADTVLWTPKEVIEIISEYEPLNTKFKEEGEDIRKENEVLKETVATLLESLQKEERKPPKMVERYWLHNQITEAHLDGQKYAKGKPEIAAAQYYFQQKYPLEKKEGIDKEEETGLRALLKMTLELNQTDGEVWDGENWMIIDEYLQKHLPEEKDNTVTEGKEETDLTIAIEMLIKNSFWQYKSGNGRMMSIENIHGEKCMIVLSEDLDRLKRIIE